MLQENNYPQELHCVTLNHFNLFVTFSSSPHLPVLMVTSWETLEQIRSPILCLSSAPLPRYQLLITLRG